MPERFVSEPLELPDAAETDFVRAELQFHGVDHSGLSYEARVFINQPDAGPETPLEAEGGYAGSFHIFGHGGCYGDVGHCDVALARAPTDLRLPHPLTPHAKIVIITDALARARAAGDTELVVTLVADLMDPEGLPLGRGPGEPLRFDSISLVTYETPPAMPPVSPAEAERPPGPAE